MTSTKAKNSPIRATRRRASKLDDLHTVKDGRRRDHRVTITDEGGRVGHGRGRTYAEATKSALLRLLENHGESPGQADPARPASVAYQGDELVSLINGFGLAKKELAETIGLAPDALYKTSRLHAAKTQSRLKEISEILRRVSEWAGGPVQAMAWYRAEPIPAFGGRTAESPVKSGQATALRDYLDFLALGGFA